jgi:mannose/cellobiose epimerase-like protein (N-acyl-D-glucosamine 2-epimerase family)
MTIWRDSDWLQSHVQRILEFYYPDCIDTAHGGYIAQFDEETGDIYEEQSKHLVATCRFITNYSIGHQLLDQDWCRSACEHGLDFLLDYHHDETQGGFHWIVEGREPVNSKRVCYGHAFALLALARAKKADVTSRDIPLVETTDLVMEQFWEDEYGLCKSEYDSTWTQPDTYRGQNANMHMCEALIAVYEAIHDDQYLDDALTIAEALTVTLTQDTDGLIWEHYTPTWEHDFTYNRETPNDTFRPWGYQPGHQIEWAKLLAILSRYSDADWLIRRAEELFQLSIDYGWDPDRGGFYYTFDREGAPVVTEKYSWEVAEAIGAAAALYERTNDSQYLDWYDTFWRYATAHMTNPEFGNWYTKVTETNKPVPITEGIAVEPGYHPIGACTEALRSLE